MNDLICIAREAIKKLQDNTNNKPHIITAEIREVSGKLYRSLEDKSIANVLSICEELLEERNWPMSVIAYDWAYRKRKDYNRDTFYIFEAWLVKYVRGWGDCDDFCTHAFGELISQYPELIEQVMLWTAREEFWVRRAAAVILIPAIREGQYQEVKPFVIADKLMQDDEDLVRKGYGWMLKVLSQKEPELVYDYLWMYKEIMPRVAFRYALEKLDKRRKALLMGKAL